MFQKFSLNLFKKLRNIKKNANFRKISIFLDLGVMPIIYLNLGGLGIGGQDKLQRYSWEKILGKLLFYLNSENYSN